MENYTVEVRLVDAPPMWTSTCCGHCFHGPSIVLTVQNVSTTVDSSPLWTLFARPSGVHIRGPSLYIVGKKRFSSFRKDMVFHGYNGDIYLALIMISPTMYFPHISQYVSHTLFTDMESNDTELTSLWSSPY